MYPFRLSEQASEWASKQAKDTNPQFWIPVGVSDRSCVVSPAPWGRTASDLLPSMTAVLYWSAYLLIDDQVAFA